MIDGNWWFRNLEGYNGTSRVSGDGTLTRTPQGDDLALRLFAANVPLEGELREALQPGMRQVWALLQPQGIIDIAANVHYIDQLNLLDVTVRAEPRSETCSLEPVRFPYRLENVQGVFTYGSGRVTFERLQRMARPRENGVQWDMQFSARRRLATSSRSPLGRSLADGPASSCRPCRRNSRRAG